VSTSEPPSRVLQGYLVRQPGEADRTFDDPEKMLRYFLSTKGKARVFSPDGAVLVTRGFLPPEA
jgi:hypothetical protein